MTAQIIDFTAELEARKKRRPFNRFAEEFRDLARGIEKGEVKPHACFVLLVSGHPHKASEELWHWAALGIGQAALKRALKSIIPHIPLSNPL